MSGQQRFTNNDETETALKRAIELYHQDQTHRESADAAKSALGELNIPEEYLERAKASLEEEKERKAQAELVEKQAGPPQAKTISEAIAQVILKIPSILVALMWLVGTMLYLYFFLGLGNAIQFGNSSRSSSTESNPPAIPNGTPKTWTFPGNRTDFVLEANPETKAQLKWMEEGGRPFWRMDVSSFGKDSEGEFSAYAKLNAGDVALQGLHHLKLRARGRGIAKMYLGFIGSGTNSYTQDLMVTPGWHDYVVDLANLGHNDDNSNWVSGDTAPASANIQIRLDNGANTLSEHGSIDIEKIELD